MAGPAALGMMSCPCLSDDPGVLSPAVVRRWVTADKGNDPSACEVLRRRGCGTCRPRLAHPSSSGEPSWKQTTSTSVLVSTSAGPTTGQRLWTGKERRFSTRFCPTIRPGYEACSSIWVSTGGYLSWLTSSPPSAPWAVATAQGMGVPAAYLPGLSMRRITDPPPRQRQDRRA